MDKHEKKWRKTKKERGWVLPAKAVWWKRLPIIRRFRAGFLSVKMEKHYTKGLGSIGIRTGYDEWVLYAIARGWC